MINNRMLITTIKVGPLQTVTTSPARHHNGAKSNRHTGAKSDCHGQGRKGRLCSIPVMSDRSSTNVSIAATNSLLVPSGLEAFCSPRRISGRSSMKRSKMSFSMSVQALDVADGGV